LGEKAVFRDIYELEPGVDFLEQILSAIDSAEVLIALIGPRWLTASNEAGKRRLDDPDDYVRVEIQAALEREILVVPALVGSAAMPTAADLPDGLDALARRHAVELSDSRWEYDVQRLIATIEREGGGRSRITWAKIAAAALIGVALIGLGAVLIPRIGDDDGTTASQNRTTVSAMQRLTVDRQRLAYEMFETLQSTITEGQETVLAGADEATFNATLRKWNDRKFELRSSFPRKFRERWREYAERVADVYTLSATGEQRKRCAWARRVWVFLEGGAAPTLRCPAKSRPGLTFGHALCMSPNATDYELLVACDADNRSQYSYERGERFIVVYEDVSNRLRDRGEDLISEALPD
jgi:TIR domain